MAGRIEQQLAAPAELDSIEEEARLEVRAAQQRAWRTLVNERLFAAEAKRAGIAAGVMAVAVWRFNRGRLFD